MIEWLEFDPVDRISAGALGSPGDRRFLIQAARGDATLTVVVEKEQVAMLSARLVQLLSAIEDELPEEGDASPAEVPPVQDLPELFRARMMRLGFDPGRDMVVLELFEDVPEGVEEASDVDELEDGGLEEAGHLVRLYATRPQMRLVAARGAEAVAAGRQTCPLCRLPMDPDGHDCPSKN